MDTKPIHKSIPRTKRSKWLISAAVLACLLIVTAGLTMTAPSWFPSMKRTLAGNTENEPDRADTHSANAYDHDAHGDDTHENATFPPAGDQSHQEAADAHNYNHEHDEATALWVSKQGEANLKLELHRVTLSPFARTINVPAMIALRPGRSRLQVTAPFTGLVTRIYRIEGETVEPGTPLFDMQLMHEELVTAQADFLRTAEELVVVDREVARIEKVAAQGAIAGKTLLARQYERQKIKASLHAQRQSLLMHRLTETQVDAILETRQLLRNLTVVAPQMPKTSPEVTGVVKTTEKIEATEKIEMPGAESPTLADGVTCPMQLQRLAVEQGQHVTAGEPLCVLVDHSKLYIEGKAFEQDIPALAAAMRRNGMVTAVFQAAGNAKRLVPDLTILYLANTIETQSRAFDFFVTLPNEIVRNTTLPDGRRFVDWRYKPGQRLRLLVPLEAAKPQIVLPVEAVVEDGAEAFVFEYHANHFDRCNVHVTYRDQDRVVIANDGGVAPGAIIAVSGAYQIFLASKNKDGNGIDPHAGHNH